MKKAVLFLSIILLLFPIMPLHAAKSQTITDFNK